MNWYSYMTGFAAGCLVMSAVWQIAINWKADDE